MSGRAKRRIWRRATVLTGLCTFLAGAVAAQAPPEGGFLDRHPNALWRVVHDLCAVDRRLLGLPAPCLEIHLRDGWAVVKDPDRPTHILVAPTRRVSGIESPLLLRPGGPNYWRDAWQARRVFERLAGRPVPRGDYALVINSEYGRTQDQLHIHIDCIWPKNAAALREAATKLGPAWEPLDLPIPPMTFLARKLQGADLDADLFHLLARQEPGARLDMGAWALAAIPEDFPDGPGFVLLAHKANLPAGDPGVGEGVLDHACRILRPPQS